ncbi:uncharacterized protein LOC134533974 [Bacillus rossius redtenbacheri]|uniref:uncharacterized protein LOC134533974 n=1 Tax=Bacillus rossius redtenbacheri TaxID=93214 RepID=UPI002FDC7E99
MACCRWCFGLVAFGIGIMAGAVLSQLVVPNIVNIVQPLSAANQTGASNESSNTKELEQFFKTVYTVPDFLFNVSKVVSVKVRKWGEDTANEVKQLEKDVVNEVRIISRDIANLHLVSDKCVCQGYTCGCCAHLEEDEIHLNSTICVNVSYLPKDYGVSFVMTLNEYVLYNETISVRNPPPVCIGMPFVKEFAELCARLYDVDAKPTKLHACVGVEARLRHVLIAKYNLGCFTIGNPEELLRELEDSFEPSVIRI